MEIKELKGTACPICEEGKMVLRNGPYGEFMGCNRFPDCTFNVGYDDLDLGVAIARYHQKVAIANVLKNRVKQNIDGPDNTFGYISMALGVDDITPDEWEPIYGHGPH